MKKSLSKSLPVLVLASLTSLMPIPAQADDVAPTSGPTQSNTCTTGVQSGPLTATDSVGNYIVVWTSSASCPLDNPDGTGTGVSAQRYNASRVKVGTEFRINQTTDKDQIAESVSYDTVGNFVVTWTSNHLPANGKDVYARRYRKNGNSMGGEFRVNTTTAGDQGKSRVAMGSAKEGLIVWTTTDATGGVIGVFSRRFGSMTGIETTEQKVPSGSSRPWSSPAVAMNANNYAVVTLTLPTISSGSIIPCVSRQACVVAVPYLPDGAPKNNIISVSPSTSTDANSSFPADSSVGMADDKDNTAVVAFFGSTSSPQPAAQRGVLAQRLKLKSNNAGTITFDRTGSLIQIAPNATNSRPDISVDSNGGFVVAYATVNGSQAAYYAAGDTTTASLAAAQLGPASLGAPSKFIPNIDFDSTTRQAIALDDDGDIVTVTYSNNRPTDPPFPADRTGIFHSTFTTDPSISFSKSAASFNESVDSTSIGIGLSERTSLDVTANFSVGGTATRGSTCGSGVDYRLLPDVTSVTIPAQGDSLKVGIDLCADTAHESNETVILNLARATNAVLASPSTFTLTIVDND